MDMWWHCWWILTGKLSVDTMSNKWVSPETAAFLLFYMDLRGFTMASWLLSQHFRAPIVHLAGMPDLNSLGPNWAGQHAAARASHEVEAAVRVQCRVESTKRGGKGVVRKKNPRLLQIKVTGDVIFPWWIPTFRWCSMTQSNTNQKPAETEVL